MKEQIEKQAIEEMAEAICGLNQSDGCFCNGGYCNHNCLAYGKAETIYNAGYRKQSVVVDDFAERLKEKMDDLTRVEHDGYTYFVVGKAFIDKIAEEMKGGEE